MEKYRNFSLFFHFDSEPRFPPFLLYVRWKFGVTFVRRCFRDGDKAQDACLCFTIVWTRNLFVYRVDALSRKWSSCATNKKVNVLNRCRFLGRIWCLKTNSFSPPKNSDRSKEVLLLSQSHRVARTVCEGF